MDLKNKPVFILLQGPSIINLEKWIKKYKDLDVTYASINRFSLVEPILEKINKHFNLLYFVNSVRMLDEKENIKKYLSLGEDRELILNPYQLLNSTSQDLMHEELAFLFEKHKTLITYENLKFDNGSFIHLLMTMIFLGYKKFILFGCDGAVDKNYKISDHYNQKEYDLFAEQKMNSQGSLADDTTKINHLMHTYFKDINMNNVEIFNCNPDSYITYFPLINYDEVIEKYESLSI